MRDLQTTNMNRSLSVVSEDTEGLVPVSSDSFWEVGKYKTTTRRIEDGSKLCHELCTLIKERGEIESSYSKSLKLWNRKWADILDKNAEYGTTESGWKAIVDESERRAAYHNRIKERLMEEVYNTVKIWQKDHYHTRALGGLKEVKEMEEAFRKVQKPWAKLFAKVEKCKKEYHLACKSERTAINNEKNAQNDNGKSKDESRKLAEKVSKCNEEKEKAKKSYDKALGEINDYNSRYMEDMTQVFEKCQEMEIQRLKFFKEMLFGIYKCVDLSHDSTLAQIYSDLDTKINSMEPGADLEWWKLNKGTGMPMNWPHFEEYTVEMHRISSNLSPLAAKNSVANHTIRLKAINRADYHAEPDYIEYSEELRRITSTRHNKSDAITPVGIGGGSHDSREGVDGGNGVSVNGVGGVILTNRRMRSDDETTTTAPPSSEPTTVMRENASSPTSSNLTTTSSSTTGTTTSSLTNSHNRNRGQYNNNDNDKASFRRSNDNDDEGNNIVTTTLPRRTDDSNDRVNNGNSGIKTIKLTKLSRNSMTNPTFRTWGAESNRGSQRSAQPQPQPKQRNSSAIPLTNEEPNSNIIPEAIVPRIPRVSTTSTTCGVGTGAHGGHASSTTGDEHDGEDIEEDGDEYEEFVDDGRPGKLVTAVYDYDPVEPDELKLKKGDKFEKLLEEDEQGWCTGRKDGRIGLYPANYAS